MTHPFLSWSGEVSHAAAGHLHDWLPLVIPGCKPWMSSYDIRPGARWSHELASALATAKLAVLVLTRENISSPWLLFEAGALSLSTNGAVIPLLLDLPVTALPAPISQFQSCTADKLGMLRLVAAVASLATPTLDAEALRKSFDEVWPELEVAISEIPPVSVRFASPTLTREEIAVLRKLMAGKQPVEIARAHGVALSTIRTQIGSIRSKTGASSIRDLIARSAQLPQLVNVLRPPDGPLR